MLSAEELQHLLNIAALRHPQYFVPADDPGDSAASLTTDTGFQLPVLEDGFQIPDHAPRSEA